MDETVKNPGNMKPRRVAMLDMAEKEGKKKVSGVTMEKDIPRGLSGEWRCVLFAQLFDVRNNT